MLQVWRGGASRVRVDEKKGDACISINLMSPHEALRKERGSFTLRNLTSQFLIF